MKFEKICSMSFQDEFVYSLFGNKGTYIEIGGHDPIRHSNTYNLEVVGNWKGFSVELDTSHQAAWNNCSERINKIFWADALNFDYKKTVFDLNLPQTINYLSVDIEPAENTFKALQQIIEQGLVFDAITFEHDGYRESVDFNSHAIDYLDSRGYKVAVSDVYFKKKQTSRPKIYETWFINKKYKKWKTIDYNDWLKTIMPES